MHKRYKLTSEFFWVQRDLTTCTKTKNQCMVFLNHLPKLWGKIRSHIGADYFCRYRLQPIVLIIAWLRVGENDVYTVKSITSLVAIITFTLDETSAYFTN